MKQGVLLHSQTEFHKALGCLASLAIMTLIITRKYYNYHCHYHYYYDHTMLSLENFAVIDLTCQTCDHLLLMAHLMA